MSFFYLEINFAQSKFHQCIKVSYFLTVMRFSVDSFKSFTRTARDAPIIKKNLVISQSVTSRETLIYARLCPRAMNSAYILINRTLSCRHKHIIIFNDLE